MRDSSTRLLTRPWRTLWSVWRWVLASGLPCLNALVLGLGLVVVVCCLPSCTLP